jgi:hypothetical protein
MKKSFTDDGHNIFNYKKNPEHLEKSLVISEMLKLTKNKTL